MSWVRPEVCSAVGPEWWILLQTLAAASGMATRRNNRQIIHRKGIN